MIGTNKILTQSGSDLQIDTTFNPKMKRLH